MYEYSPHAKVALHQEIDRLKSENRALKDANEVFINHNNELRELIKNKEAENKELRSALEVSYKYIKEQFENPKYTISIYKPHLDLIKQVLKKGN